ncbi:hypothetical protein GCM10009779_17060 [Polymorphospora rubra]|uniref:Uncharacterized protein n=1 Tax=Polymorphospora rubra TaxID=338584 RepID=A0A810N8C0_9ACTN|nr:hypothetical protein Prubr_50590 [Polymorphospora rubra]
MGQAGSAGRAGDRLKIELVRIDVALGHKVAALSFGSVKSDQVDQRGEQSLSVGVGRRLGGRWRNGKSQFMIEFVIPIRARLLDVAARVKQTCE